MINLWSRFMNTSTLIVSPGSNSTVWLSPAVCRYDLSTSYNANVGNIITPSESLLLELALYDALAVIVACLFISSTMSGVKNSLQILI
jgi:hypothetical protein